MASARIRPTGMRGPAVAAAVLALAAIVLAGGGCAPKRVLRPTTPQPVPPGPGAADSLGERAADLALRQVGKEYRWGAAGPEAFDCSGLTRYVFGELGVTLPRAAQDQARAGRQVARGDLAPGDLVFFRFGGDGVDHVGIFLGDGRFVHAPRNRQPVGTQSLQDSPWTSAFVTGRRLD